MKPLKFLESLLLLLAIALVIPIPTSGGAPYPAFPLAYLSVVLFSVSRLIRHIKPVPAATSKLSGILVAIAESIVYGALVFVIHESARLA